VDSATSAVYVHAPFCARRCFYCDFAVKVDRAGGHNAWLRAISAEWDQIRSEELFSFPEPLETLYVGGGTPSLLGTRAMGGLASLIGPRLLGHPLLEWTAEANPESFTPGIAGAWREAGVNRVSLGVQSFHEPSLRWMGRLHGSTGGAEAVRNARGAGFGNVSADLIFGLPGHLGRDWSDDLVRALDLGVEHMSLYGLTVEARTPLGRAVAGGRERVASEDRYRDEYLEAVERLTGAGYLHYEVSSFALPGRESRHNEVYWSGRSYLGLGNGAHSFRKPLRRWNLRDWEEYSTSVAKGDSAIAGHEVLDPAALRLERIWLGLRARRGVSLASIPARAVAVTERWIRRGWARAEAGRLRLTCEGWLLLDALAIELDEAVTSRKDME
jgi:oxygen-independent coproporphyrinogen-3 oxidase